jgi:hypothetical protein
VVTRKNTAPSPGGPGDPLRPSDSAAGDAGGLHRPASGVAGTSGPANTAKRAAHGSKAPVPPVDPELEADLGPELDMRGDVTEAALRAALTQAAENLELAQRGQAEFDNYRKRMTRDQADAIKQAHRRGAAPHPRQHGARDRPRGGGR